MYVYYLVYIYTVYIYMYINPNTYEPFRRQVVMVLGHEGCGVVKL